MEMQMVLLASALAVLNSMGLQPEAKMAIQDRARIEAAAQAQRNDCVAQVVSQDDRYPSLKIAKPSQENDSAVVHRCASSSR